MATLNPISQRIALEGAQEIAKQLADLGVKGDAAFKQISAAAQAATTQLSPFQQRLNAVGASFTQFGARVSAVAATIGTVRLGNLSQEFNNLGTAAGTFGRRALTITAAIAGAAAAVGLFVKSAAQAADDAEDNAQALGITIEQYQELTFAAAAVGVPIEKAAIAMRKFQNASVEISEKQGKALEALRAQFGLTSVSVFRDAGLLGQSGTVARTALDGMGVKVVALNDNFEGLRAKMVAMGVRFINFGQNAKDGAKATDAAGKAVEKFQLELTDGDGKLKSFDERLGDLAEGFKNLGEGPEALSRASAIMGERVGGKLLPLLLKGRAGLAELTAEFNKLGIGLKSVDTALGERTTVSLVKLDTIITGLKNKIGLLFAPGLADIVDAFTTAIIKNSRAIQDQAKSIATKIKPEIEDLIKLISGKELTFGAFGEETVVKRLAAGFETVRSTISGVVEFVKSAFTGILGFLDTVAAKINAVFGTKLTGSELGIILVLGQITGAFGLLTAAAGVLAAVLVALVAIFGLLTSPISLIVLGVAAAAAAFFLFKDDVVGIFQALPGLIQSAISSLTDILLAPFRLAADGIRSILGPIADLVRNILSGIGSIRLPQGAEGGGGSGFARGGMVFGPGTSRSDSIPAWLSRGEFVINAAATKHWGVDFLRAINQARLPKFNLGGLVDGFANPFDGLFPMGPRFADGGLAMAGAGTSGRPLLIPLGDGGPPVRASVPQSGGKRLERESVRRRIRSNGRKPGWYS